MAGYFKKVKTPWTSQPQIPAGIDKNNPDTRGLILATLSGSKIYDATRKEPLSSGSVIDRTASNFNLNDDSKNWLTTYGGAYSIVAKNRVFSAAWGDRSWFATRVAYPTSGIYHYINSSGYYVFSHWNGVDYYANSFLGRSDKDEVLVTYDGTNIGFTLWSAGTTKYTYSAALAQYAASSSGSGFMGTDNGQSIGAEWLFVFNRVLSEAEALRIRAAPWKLFTPQERRVFVSVASSGITGTFSVTESADVPTISGLVNHTGSLVVTESPDITSISGYIAHLGSLSVTESSDTASLTGKVAHTGTLAVTETVDTVSFNGLVAHTGTLAVTESADVVAITGGSQITITGSIAITESPDVADFRGPSANTFSQEVEFRRYYVRKGKKILLFDSVDEAEEYIKAEQVAEEAIAKAKVSSRQERRKIKKRIIKDVLPAESIDTDWLAEMMQRFAINFDLPKLLAEQDYNRVMEIHAMAKAMQDDEDDIEMLLMWG